jgi:hypothetical protein
VSELRIGVVGYSLQAFDENQARRFIQHGYDSLAMQHPGSHFTVVSGLTNLGVVKIAYEEAAYRGWRTVGITLRYRLDRQDPLFPVDERIIIDGQRGDDSPAFLQAIDALIRVGGGPQSYAETEAFRRLKPKAPIIEHDLSRF